MLLAPRAPRAGKYGLSHVPEPGALQGRDVPGALQGERGAAAVSPEDSAPPGSHLVPQGSHGGLPPAAGQEDSEVDGPESFFLPTGQGEPRPEGKGRRAEGGGPPGVGSWKSLGRRTPRNGRRRRGAAAIRAVAGNDSRSLRCAPETCSGFLSRDFRRGVLPEHFSGSARTSAPGWNG